jgi:hypothetical protein
LELGDASIRLTLQINEVVTTERPRGSELTGGGDETSFPFILSFMSQLTIVEGQV